MSNATAAFMDPKAPQSKAVVPIQTGEDGDNSSSSATPSSATPDALGFTVRTGLQGEEATNAPREAILLRPLPSDTDVAPAERADTVVTVDRVDPLE
jgi:hypothetical protein